MRQENKMTSQQSKRFIHIFCLFFVAVVLLFVVVFILFHSVPFANHFHNSQNKTKE